MKKKDELTKVKDKQMIWRLGTLPSVLEVTTLIDKGVITKEEARDMLFRRTDIKEMPKEQEVTRFVTTHYSPPDVEVINRFVDNFFKPFWRI